MFFYSNLFITNLKAMSFGSLYKGKRLVKKIFFPGMIIIDFFPHLYRRFFGGRPKKALIEGQKRASVDRRTKTRWTKQLSKNTWILIISWKTGVLGVNKAKISKILKNFKNSKVLENFKNSGKVQNSGIFQKTIYEK